MNDKEFKRLKFRLAQFGCLIAAGAVLLAFGIIQISMELLERVCPACFGH